MPIPLLCNICPRKPHFSDVSHLLTHIASKGHLSHYYKVKVRSGTEDESRRLIEEYDEWYTRNGLEELMCERMNMKEKRRARPSRTQGETQGYLVSMRADATPGRRRRCATFLTVKLRLVVF